MAIKHSTSAERRRQLIAELAREAVELDRLLRELMVFFVQLKRSCATSRRLGNRLYRLLRDAERRIG